METRRDGPGLHSCWSILGEGHEGWRGMALTWHHPHLNNKYTEMCCRPLPTHFQNPYRGIGGMLEKTCESLAMQWFVHLLLLTEALQVFIKQGQTHKWYMIASLGNLKNGERLKEKANTFAWHDVFARSEPCKHHFNKHNKIRNTIFEVGFLMQHICLVLQVVIDFHW
jgi:hypothetical protein